MQGEGRAEGRGGEGRGEGRGDVSWLDGGRVWQLFWLLASYMLVVNTDVGNGRRGITAVLL